MNRAAHANEDGPGRADRRLAFIDGLRAFAVVAVVLFHIFPALAAGGYIGVDIFFVISGFVIALRYLEPMVAGEIGFRTFFARRVRRLVPAYFAMLLAVTLFAVWIMVPKDLINFGYSLIGQAFYAQNLVFWAQGEYFDAALLKPLLHTWSLGIEEQFYLCFPLLVLAIRWRPRLAIVATLLLIVATIAVSTVVEQISAKTTFYWLPFRAWEFLAGIGAAWLFRRGIAEHLPRIAANALALLAVAALLVAIFLFDKESAGVLTQGLLAVSATVALCVVQRRLSPLLSGAFTNRVTQHFGAISYSWYLWHWPPIVFLFLLRGHPTTGPAAAAVLLLGYALGLLSWWLLERGVSRAGWLARPWRTVAMLIAFLTFSAGVGAALVASDGLVRRYPSRMQPLLLAQMDRPDGRCPILGRLRHWRAQTCRLTQADGRGGILFIGDSHVEMQKNVLIALGTRYAVPVYITTQNCRIIDFGVDGNCKWPVWRRLEREIGQHHITRVVVVALWPDGLDRVAFDAAITRLRATGVQVVLERPTPRDATLAPAFYLTRPDAWQDLSLYPRAAHDARSASVNAAIAGWAAGDARITVLDPVPLLCPGDHCLFAHAGKPLYSDTHHLTAAGVRLIEPLYDPLFAAARGDRLHAAAITAQ